jgi:adenylate kinase family enzyme
MNLCLVGPPGSGKGSYGRHLSHALGIPIFAASDLLRRFRPELDLSSGRLVDCRTVCDTLLLGLQQKQQQQQPTEGCSNSNRPRPRHRLWHLQGTTTTIGTGEIRHGYILDGFPRTLEQTSIMEETWPTKYRIHAAIKLAVPDVVCERKLLGRRMCTLCGGNYNVNGVEWNGWNLPPHLPTSSSSQQHPPCRRDPPCCDRNHNHHWKTRDDDATIDIVRHRLNLYHDNMDPILEYFARRNRLLKLEPFHGFKDVPILVEEVRKWLQAHHHDDDLESAAAGSEGS